MERPDLSQVTPEIRTYIEYLESLTGEGPSGRQRMPTTQPLNPDLITFNEPPTTVNILTFSQLGFVKRTPRHLYGRQHRGGMGIFDLDFAENDRVAFILSADLNQMLLLFTNKARVFRHAVSKLDESPVRSKGTNLDRLALDAEEQIVDALPERAAGYVALASSRGYIRCLRHHLFGEHMKPGTPMYNYSEFGPLASVCWTPGDADILLLSRNGMGIRFNEKILPPMGTRGINLAGGDEVVAVTTVVDDSPLFLVSADGKGTIRLMSGFAPNKSPGGAGKIAMKTDHLTGAVSIRPTDELFMISESGKIIRFLLDEVPTTAGVVQGVNCMALRNDRVAHITLANPSGS